MKHQQEADREFHSCVSTFHCSLHFYNREGMFPPVSISVSEINRIIGRRLKQNYLLHALSVHLIATLLDMSYFKFDVFYVKLLPLHCLGPSAFCRVVSLVFTSLSISYHVGDLGFDDVICSPSLERLCNSHTLTCIQRLSKL
jgi:hypothetical protein